jgi:hypothetical protein
LGHGASTTTANCRSLLGPVRRISADRQRVFVRSQELRRCIQVRESFRTAGLHEFDARVPAIGLHDKRVRVASRNFVTGCLISDVTGKPLLVSFRSGCMHRKAEGQSDAGGGRDPGGSRLERYWYAIAAQS